MPSITSLILKLQQNYPDFSFLASDRFMWSPLTKTVHYDAHSSDAAALLHELAHAILGHSQYIKDIELVIIERDAWDYAQSTLSPTYKVIISDATIQDNLDTYRQWLHDRSLCPTCSATGLQTREKEYSCIACGRSWRVNEARSCALRRYATN